MAPNFWNTHELVLTSDVRKAFRWPAVAYLVAETIESDGLGTVTVVVVGPRNKKEAKAGAIYALRIGGQYIANINAKGDAS